MEKYERNNRIHFRIHFICTVSYNLYYIIILLWRKHGSGIAVDIKMSSLNDEHIITQSDKFIM